MFVTKLFLTWLQQSVSHVHYYQKEKLVISSKQRGEVLGVYNMSFNPKNLQIHDFKSLYPTDLSDSTIDPNRQRRLSSVYEHDHSGLFFSEQDIQPSLEVAEDKKQTERERKEMEEKLMKRVESEAKRIKQEIRQISCDMCGKHSKKSVKLCNGCHKAWYCSLSCQQRHWIIHRQACQLLQPLQKMRGFNTLMTKHSKYSQHMMYRHAKRYLSQNKRGCLCYSVFPASRKDWVEAKLKNTNTSAMCFQDPINGRVFHCFIIPASAMKSRAGVPVSGLEEEGFGGIDPKFAELCDNYKTFRHFVPMLNMKMEKVEPDVNLLNTKQSSLVSPSSGGGTDDWEVTALSYYVLSERDLV